MRMGGRGPDEGLPMFPTTAPTMINLPFIKIEGSSDEPIDTSEDGCPRARGRITGGHDKGTPIPQIQLSIVLVDCLQSIP